MRDAAGWASAWSTPAAFAVGLLAPGDWGGAWIGAADAGDEAGRRRAPWLRRRLELHAAPRRAVLHVASLGYHEVHVNGAKLGDTLLAPSVSDLSERVQATSYDVTEALHAGANALGLWLGPGWSRYPRYAVPAGPLVRAALDLEFADGATARVATDTTWRTHGSGVEAIGRWDFGDYGGERVDAGSAGANWSAVDFDDADWSPATAYDCGLAIVPEQVEPNRAIAELHPAAIAAVAPGVHRIDFGRAFTGVVEVALRGEPGAAIGLEFAEREDQRATYAQRSELVLGADGTGTFRHRFDYVAARWLTVSGTAVAPRPDDVRAWLVHSGYRPTTAFACGDPLLQRIHDTVAWTFECLSLGGYVVDCAHRERWGYGGDSHATMETALAHFDLAAFYRDWLDDWAAIQDEHGNLPFTCPTYHGGGGPAWSGIVVMLPWEIYRRTGDRDLLARMWPTIARWIAFLETKTTDGILQFYFDDRYTADVYSFLGDWVPPGGVQAGGPPDARRAFFNNAYRVWAVRTAAAIAKAIGRDADAAGLARRADELADAVHRRFYDAAQGVYVEARQTYYALPVLAGIGPEEVRAALFARLVDDVERRRHVDTGIHGTWFLVKLLLERHRADLLALVASQTDAPSWGDMLARGATTIWEQWDGVHSRMHSSFLSIGAFFVEGLLGIRPDAAAPGYAHFELAPAIGAGGLARASGHQDTVRGTIAAAWEVHGDTAELAVTVPPGATATVRIPTAAPSGVQESGVAAAAADGVRAARAIAADEFACEVGSGSYRFTFAAPRRR
ncbi:MAG: family 78 glycoside hydrolase catalytic domain [Planctomycetota bacterium]